MGRLTVLESEQPVRPRLRILGGGGRNTKDWWEILYRTDGYGDGLMVFEIWTKSFKGRF